MNQDAFCEHGAWALSVIALDHIVPCSCHVVLGLACLAILDACLSLNC